MKVLLLRVEIDNMKYNLVNGKDNYTPFKEEGVYMSHCVGLSVGLKPYFVRPISDKPLL